MVLETQAREIRQEKEIKGIQVGGGGRFQDGKIEKVAFLVAHGVKPRKQIGSFSTKKGAGDFTRI